MVITYYGLSCFKIQSGDTVIAIDPFGKESGLTPPRFEAHVALSTHAHENHNNVESISEKKPARNASRSDAGGDERMLTITGPGEYEFRSIVIRGIPSFHDDKKGAKKGKNTIYAIEWEDMRLVHLGDYGEAELRSEVQEAIGTPDILFVPVGGGDTIDAEMAAKLVSQIEPRIIVPMHYKISGLKDKLEGVEAFLKEMGEKAPPEDRLTIKKKDLPTAEQSKIMVLKTP